jgi:hypothetical protein
MRGPGRGPSGGCISHPILAERGESMNRMLGRIGGILFSIIFVAAGIFTLVMGVRRMMDLNAGKYIETQATITRIDSVETTDSDTGTRTEYDITVEYNVNGRKYVSHLGEQPKKFYEGMTLTVLYNADRPTDVILPGQTASFIMIGMGIVGIVAGVAAFIKRPYF